MIFLFFFFFCIFIAFREIISLNRKSNQDYLMTIQKHPIKSKFCKLRLLCRSLAGNNVYCLTVTAPVADDDVAKVSNQKTFHSFFFFCSLAISFPFPLNTLTLIFYRKNVQSWSAHVYIPVKRPLHG